MRQITELMQTKVTYPRAKKDRQAGIWNLERNKELREAIEACLATGETVIREVGGALYRVKPEYPLIDSAMQNPKFKSLLKVSVAIYTLAWSVGVKETV